MKTTTWIFLAVIGAILLMVGLSIAWRVEMRKQTFGIPPYTYEMDIPTTPYVMPGIGLTIVGGLLITFSILGFSIGYSKRAAVEVISEGIKKAATNVKYCPKCGASMSLDTSYCPKCGHKQS